MKHRVQALLVLSCWISVGRANDADLVAPSFIAEPPTQVTFSNSTGTVVPCSADGRPPPSVTWVTRDGMAIRDIPGLRHIRPNGYLSFPSFSAENYRRDVHSVVYRCVVSNKVGAVSSREVRVKAVVSQGYDIRLSDEFVLRGNMAILACPVPGHVDDYVKVKAWERGDGFLVTPDSVSGKYGVLENGDLYIRYVTERDGSDTFRCYTENSVTKEMRSSSNSARVIVTEPHANQPPRMVRNIEKVMVKNGERATLSCVAHSHPAPAYRWLKKKGNLLLTAPDLGGSIRQEGGVLIFHTVTPSDAGVYVCLVSNTVGEDRTETRLIVEEPLSITVTPEEILAVAGQTISFNCSASGGSNGNIKISWLKDAKPLSAYTPGGSRVVFFPPFSPKILTLKSIRREDTGIYQCFATSPSDSSQASARLLAGDTAPDFLSTFPERTVRPGSPVSLSCSVSGSPPPEIKWTLDSVWPLSTRPGLLVSHYVIQESGHIASYVNISSVDVSDGGVYTCFAVNGAGSISHSARLNVYGPLTVRRVNGNLTALAEENFAVQCPFGGYPYDTVRWKKEGRRLPANQRQKVHTNGTLSISNVQRGEDDGLYICEITSKQGPPVSGTFWISVRTGPKVLPFKFQENLHEGMRTATTCIVPAGDKPFTIQWLKDGIPLRDGVWDVTIVAPDSGFVSTLSINNLAYDHNGNYTCAATNAVATGSYSATLTVKIPPRWILKPKDTSAVAGRSAMIDCQAEGVPQPNVRWKKAVGDSFEDFRTIVSSSNVHILVNGSLNFKEVEPSHAGSYLCEADNGVGTGLAYVINLTVHSAPLFPAKFSAVATRRGQRTTIECFALRGEKPLEFSWSKNGALVDADQEPRYSQITEDEAEGGKSTIIISKAERQDSALFTCSAANKYGKDTTNVQLTVQDIPDAPQNLDVHDVSSRSVRLTWNRPFDGNSPITNYIVAWRQLDGRDVGGPLTVPGSETTLTVRGLIPSTRYFFRVKCRNELGESQYGAEVAVTSLQEPPRNAPTDISVVALSSGSINVTWKYALNNDDMMNVDGFYVGYKIKSNSETYTFSTVNVSDGRFKYQTVIHGLRRYTEYSIILQAYNGKGAGPPSEEIFVTTLQFDAPETPIIKSHYATSSSITLTWELPNLQDSPVSGFSLYYRWEGTGWQEIHLTRSVMEYSLKGLRCGTLYRCYLVAFNAVGRSNASNVISVRTEGNAPVAPEKRQLLKVNSTSVSMHLDGWQDGECPVNSFLIKYKRTVGKSGWVVVSENADPRQKDLTIVGLEPGTWYVMFMSARNDAGTTDAEYTFATLTLSGGQPPNPSSVSDITGQGLYHPHLVITVPLVSFTFVVSLLICAACFVAKRRRHTPRRPSTTDGASCTSETVKPEQLPLSVAYQNAPEPLYFPSPYATGRLHEQHQHAGNESSTAGTRTPHRELRNSCTKQLRSVDTVVTEVAVNGCTYDIPYAIGRLEKYETLYEPPIIYFPAYHRGARNSDEVIYEIPDRRSRPKSRSSRSWRGHVFNGNSSSDSENEETLHSLQYNEIVREESRESETECDRLWKAYDVSHYETTKHFSESHLILS